MTAFDKLMTATGTSNNPNISKAAASAPPIPAAGYPGVG